MAIVQNHLDKALDAALEMTFPASDPIAVNFASPAKNGPERAVDQQRRKRSSGAMKVNIRCDKPPQAAFDIPLDCLACWCALAEEKCRVE